MPRFNGVPVEEKKPRFGGQPVEEPSVAEDVVKSGAAGVARGAADLAATPSTLGDAVYSGMLWLTDKVFGTNLSEDAQRYYSQRNKNINNAIGVPIFPEDGGSVLGSENLRRGMSYLTGGGSEYQPKTTAGEYARTVGEFAPSAVVAPGSLVHKGVQSVVPALASETAGQLTEGSDLEPYARVVGVLAGGVGANMAMSRQGPKIPKAADIKRETGDLYETQIKPALKQVEVAPEAHKSVVDAMRGSVADDLVDEAHGSLISFLDRQQGKVPDVNLIGPRPQGETATVWDMEKMRRGAQAVGKSNVTNTSQGALSGKVVDALDDAMRKIDPADLRAPANLDPEQAMKLLETARSGWSTGLKAQTIEQAIENANHYASGLEIGLRSEFKKLLKGRNARQFSPAEREAIARVADGTLSQNMLRYAGKFSGAVGALMGGATHGPAGAVGVPALGAGARYAAGQIASDNAAVVDALVKSGGKGSQLYQGAINAQTEARRMAIARTLLQSSIAARTGEKVPSY